MERKGSYINTEIAEVIEPQTASLSGLANFVQFEAVTKNESGGGELKLHIANVISHNDNEEKQEEINNKESRITFTAEDKNQYVFYGTTQVEKISNTIFYLDKINKSNTAQNIRQCLLQNSFLSSNYKIEIGFEGGAFNNEIRIRPLDNRNSKILTAEGSYPKFVSISNKITPSNSDSIFNNSPSASIELEVYTLEEGETFLGDKTLPESSLGTYMTTLNKAYFGEPLWFNLNALMNNKSSYSNEFLEATDWCNAGTATPYRFIARRFDGKNREPFYISEVLYNITGYDRTLETNDLSAYVFDVQNDNPTNDFKPLTRQPELTHISGQRQYFNFLFSDSEHEEKSDIELALRYQFLSQSGMELGSVDLHAKNKKEFKVVNTIKLDIDGAWELVKAQLSNKTKVAGRVNVYLVRGAKNKDIVSQALAFRIQPSCLYKVKNFAFLNALGGWSSFSFGGEEKNDFKSSGETIFKTLTPKFDKKSDLESVFNKEVKETFTVETLPINRKTVEWLKEMSVSPVVYELAEKPKDSRYIIVECI